MTPGEDDLWFLPLGGSGEIGMNLNLYGHNGSWLMVDCGITFEGDGAAGRSRVVAADPGFIVERRSSLVGIVATHAHEDHIGALPHLIDQLQVPIYTTPFTASILRQKFRRAGVTTTIVEVLPPERLSLGPFQITWLPVTHSTPETHALLIDTPAGRLLHTADWKIDPGPVVGPAFDPAAFGALGDRNLDAVVCDSTNAAEPGHSVSESALADGLREVIGSAPGRVVVVCFASNVARLQTLGTIAADTGRYLGVFGHSLQVMIESAQACGYLSKDFSPAEKEHLGYLPPEEVLAIATGSQGEPGAALHRLATDSHPDLNLTAGDTVIFSARAIPGNEQSIEAIVRRLTERGIHVVQASDSNRPIHASGHPCADELKQIYGWSRPRVAIPVHGEPAHMTANARIAASAGVPVQLVGKNGDLFDIPGERVRRDAVNVGRIALSR